MMRPARRPPLFPYTTLFRSRRLSTSMDRNVRFMYAWPRKMEKHDIKGDIVGAAMGTGGGSLVGAVFSHVARSEEHTSELQSRFDLVCRLLLEKKKNLSPTLA